MLDYYKVVGGIAKATNDLVVGQHDKTAFTDEEIASLFGVKTADVATTKEPEIVPVKNLVRWNNARLDGKQD